MKRSEQTKNTQIFAHMEAVMSPQTADMSTISAGLVVNQEGVLVMMPTPRQQCPDEEQKELNLQK